MSTIKTITTWQQKALEKRENRDKSIPDEFRIDISLLPGKDVLNVADIPPSFGSFLSNLDIEITDKTMNLGSLLENLRNGVWSAEQVTRAFCKRAMIAQKLVNCCTEIFIDSAIERSRKLDAHMKKTGKPVGPLHGLPISFKDQIDVKGVEMTMCYINGIGKPSEENAVIVDLLISQGAVPYVKTNMPQTIMFSEAYNNVWGRTLNPFNRNLSCGGSSGGEGALVAMRGSILGVGTDVGGSVRGPSGFQGLYGLRPSYNRLPYAKASNSLQGQEVIPSVMGPLTKSIDGLRIFLKAILDAKPWNFDPYVLRQPWNEEMYHLADHGGEGSKLCFAIMWDDGICKPMPPNKRALEKVKVSLEARGHKVIDWIPNGISESMDIMWKVFSADGGKDIQLALDESGEPRIGYSEDDLKALANKSLSAYDYWQVAKKRETVIRKQLDMWEATVSETGTGRPVDAIIAPVNANCPPPHGKGQANAPNRYIAYTGFCNVADYVSAVVPVAKVDPSLDIKPAAHEFRSECDKAVYELYEPEQYRGAPVGIQCIGRKNEEEAVIRMAEIIDEALKANM